MIEYISNVDDNIFSKEQEYIDFHTIIYEQKRKLTIKELEVLEIYINRYFKEYVYNDTFNNKENIIKFIEVYKIDTDFKLNDFYININEEKTLLRIYLDIMNNIFLDYINDNLIK